MEKNIYVCITESLCCTAEIKHNITNQLYFNKIKKKKNPALHRVSTCLLTRLVELKRLASELLHQRQGLNNSLTCRE